MPATTSAHPSEPRWWLFVHQIPPKPDYLRVKIGRRLTRIGAVALKNTVYLLPRTDACREDLQWLANEIRAGGGEAMVFAAEPADGLSDEGARALFAAARDADYAQLADEARALLALHQGSREPVDLSAVARLQRKHDEIAAIDFFGATGREVTDGLLRALRACGEPAVAPVKPPPLASYQGRTWVTRQGIKVDRIACAWLILRHIDPQATFKFVQAAGYVPLAGEVRFDMFAAEFTHEGDQCSFEVLIARLGLGDQPGLRALAEIVHDIDIKDGKFARPEAAGVAAYLHGLAQACPGDVERVQRGCAYFDDLRQAFKAAPL